MIDFEAELKLFAFQPKGHGELSFFVMALTKEEAVMRIDAYIADPANEISEIQSSRWGTDYFQMMEVQRGEVIVNAND